MLQDQSRNRTPMPGAQAEAAAPPDTGLARAEAGIATMLAAEAAPYPDAELIAIGRQWPGLVAAFNGTSGRLGNIEEDYPEPERPKELNVLSFDIMNDFPSTQRIGQRYLPYDAEQIEALRAVPRIAVYVSNPRGGFLRSDGTLININESAERRAESVIAAWDRWRSEIAAYEVEHDLPALKAACQVATEAYDAAILRARSVPAQTLAGVLVKAKIAAEICGPWQVDEGNDDALDEKAILESVVADILTIGKTAAKPDPIFAVLAEAQRLDAVWHAISAECDLPTTEPPELEKRRTGALNAFWDHWNETVLKTVPTTAAGCAALSRYVVEYLDRDKVDLNEGPEGVNHDVLRLIMRSPMLPVGQAETVAGA